MKKPYNRAFEFFTKPLGPGHYEPTQELTKPKSQGPGWGAAKEKQRGEQTPTATKSFPGPG